MESAQKSIITHKPPIGRTVTATDMSTAAKTSIAPNFQLKSERLYERAEQRGSTGSRKQSDRDEGFGAVLAARGQECSKTMKRAEEDFAQNVGIIDVQSVYC
jgi:hypothetical protein